MTESIPVIPLDPLTGALGGVALGALLGGRLVRSAVLGAAVGTAAWLWNQYQQFSWSDAVIQQGGVIQGD